MSAVAEKAVLERRLAEVEDSIKTIERGLSKKEKRLRDEFAMAIAPSMIVEWYAQRDFDLFKRVWQMADLMMAERDKGGAL